MTSKTVNKNENGRLRLMFDCAIVCALFFGADAFLEFTTDTYRTFAVGVGKKAKDMLMRNGRPVIALYYKCFGLTGLPQEKFYYISFGTGLILAAASLYALSTLLEEIFHSRRKAFLTSLLLVINLFIIEYFMFVETMGFLTGVFFAVLAACFTAYFYAGKGILYLIPALFSLLIAQFAYQPTVGIFCVILLPLVSYYAGGKTARFIRNNVVLGTMFGIVNVATIVMMKHYQSYRSAFTVVSTIENVKWTLKTIWEVIRYSYKILDGILPNGTFLGTVVLLTVLTVVKAVLCCPREKVPTAVASVIYSMAAVTALQILYYAVGNQHAMRICYTVGALPGVAMMHFFLLDVPGSDQNTEGSRQGRSGKGVLSGINVAAAVLLVVFLCGQYLSFQRVIIDRYKGNEADRLYIETIGQAIREYEQESGTEVTKVAVCQDAYVPDSWVEFTSDRYSRARSLNRTWSDIDSLNYYLGRKFRRADDNEAIREQFAGKDWNAFSRDQLVFEGNTLYLCVY